MSRNEKRVRFACYTTNVSMSVVANLSPVLFITFHDLYQISYSLLGLLVFVNFLTQLSVDLMFSFFSHKINMEKAIKAIPPLTILGFLIYGGAPWLFFAEPYVGLVLGTVVFSAASGFCEVLISPLIAALPSENPEREMSKLHSVYAWGVVGVIITSTLYLQFLGRENWQGLVFFFLLVPALAMLLFYGATLPTLVTPSRMAGVLSFLKEKGLWLCVGAILLGGAAECTMAQWCSGYLEQAMQIPKIWGDIFGVAMFAVMLGLGRTLYAKYGSNVKRVLCFGAIGSTVCYLLAAISSIPFVGLIACAMTGLCTSMLWPGSLVVASDRFPQGGVFVFAMMAAGGDLGAAIGPQLVGVITDAVVSAPRMQRWAERFSLTVDQLGMKLGLLVGVVFSLVAIIVYGRIWRGSKSHR